MRFACGTCGRGGEGGTLRSENGNHRLLTLPPGRTEFSPDSRWLVVATGHAMGNQLRIIELRTLRTVHAIRLGEWAPRSTIRFLDNQRLLVLWGRQARIVSILDRRIVSGTTLLPGEYAMAYELRGNLLVTSTWWQPTWTRFRSLKTRRTLALMDLGDTGDWIAVSGTAWDASPAVLSLVRIRTQDGLAPATRWRRPGLLRRFFDVL